MAARFWVTGGTGNWNDTSNWSATSGGASGASVPVAADAALLDASSGSGTVTLDISPDIQTLTCTGFIGTLAFGTNTISLNSTGTIFTGATTMTVTGTPQIICTNSSATARTISPAAVTEANSISFRITAGTGTLSLPAGSYRNLDFTDGVNPTGYAGALGNAVQTIYGNFKASTGMTRTPGTSGPAFAATSGTKTIDTAGVTFDCPFSFNGVGGTWQLQAALTSGATRATTLTNGTLDLNNYTLTTGLFSSTASTARTLAFGTGKIVVSGSGATVWTTNTATNLTVTGSKRVEFNYSGSTGTRTIQGSTSTTAIEGVNLLDFYVVAGSDTVAFASTRLYGTIDFYDAGVSTFTGIFNNNSLSVYGNLAVKSGMTVSSGALVTSLLATSGTKTITSNGQTLDFPITINGPGGTFQLADAFTMGSTRAFTLTAGTFNTNGYALSTGVVSSSNTNVRALNLGASAVTLTSTSATPWNLLDSTNMTFSAGTSTITCTSTTQAATFNGGGQTYYNIVSPDSGYNFLLTSAPVINNLTASNTSTAGTKPTRIDTNTTINTLTLTGANGNCRVLFYTFPTGTQLTATANTVSLVDVDFRDIAAAGAAIPWTGTRLGNIGNTANITFAAGKTVYWNKAAGGYWGDDAWATASGGVTSTLNQPLAQDMAVFDNTGLTAGSTVILGNYLFGGLDCSSLTNALIFQTDSTYSGPTICKNVILSSTVSFTGTVNIAFNGRLGTQSITSAGVNWACGISIQPLSTFLLVDDLSTDDVSFTLGPIDLNGNVLTCNTFSSSTTATRSIAFNGGEIDVTGNNATVWSCADLTGFSYTGTPTVNFTYSGSTGTRTINNGGTAGATESNVVDINTTAGADIIAFGIASSVRNLNFTGFSGVASTIASGFIYGNLTLSATQTIALNSLATTFAATSGTKTITTNGITIDRPLTFNGVGGTWVMQDALTLGSTQTLTMTNGTLQLKASTTNTAGGFATLGENQKFLQSTISGTQATLSVASGTISVAHLSIKDIVATGGATFNAYTTNANADLGNNTGWDFSQASAKYIYTRRKLKRIIF